MNNTKWSDGAHEFQNVGSDHPALLDMTTKERLLHAPDHNWRTVNEWAELIGRGLTTTRQELLNLSFAFYVGDPPTEFERRPPTHGLAWEFRRRP